MGVSEVLGVEVEATEENWSFSCVIGEWDLVPAGDAAGDVTERMGLLMVVGGWFGCGLEILIPAAGPSGLLKRLRRLGVLVGVGVSLGMSPGEDSFDPCWT